MRRRLCGKLLARVPSQLLLAQSHSNSHRFDSLILAENRDFCVPHLHSTPLFGGPRQNIAMTFGTEKLE